MVNAERESFIKKCLSDLDEDGDSLPRIQTDLRDYVEAVYRKDLNRLHISPEAVLTRFRSQHYVLYIYDGGRLIPPCL